MADSGGYDFIIVGSGMGGGALAYALRESGARILLLERGDFLPQEPQNWQVSAVFKLTICAQALRVADHLQGKPLLESELHAWAG